MADDDLEVFLQRMARLHRWAVHSGVSARPDDAICAPWSSDQVHQLNLRQDDHRGISYRCPLCQTDLYATRSGWVCAKNHCRFRQDWALDEHVNRPFIPPPRTDS